MPQIIIPYQPLGYEDRAPYETVQIDFWETEADTPALVGASRSGKTMTGAGKGLRNTLREWQEHKRLVNGFVVGPRWDEVRGVLVEEYLKVIPPDLVWKTADGGIFHETQKVIRLVDFNALREGRREPGPLIYYRSGEDPKAIYGFTCGWVHQDEAAQMVQEVMGASVERCSDPPNQLFATFTPQGGRRHWANQKWALGQKQLVDGRRGLKIVNNDPQSPAWLMIYTDNYTLDEAWRRMVEANLGLDTAYGRQELFAEVMDVEGLVYPMFDPVHVRPAPEGFTQISGGIDRALSGITAVSLVGLDLAGRTWCFHEWGERAANITDVALHCVGLQQRYPGLWFDADPAPSAEIELATLRNLGVNIRRAQKKDMLDVGVKLIRERLNVQLDGLPGMFFADHCKETIAQMQSWCFIKGVEGGIEVTSDKVERFHRDHIDAMRYAVMGLFRQPFAADIPVHWTVRGRRVT